MTVTRLDVLLCCVLVLAAGGHANAQVTEYVEVPAWPDPATSAAGTPAPWNFGQISGVATSANEYILVLHRGARPILLFDSGGRFVRGWGDGLFSNGKVGGIAPADRVPGQSGYTAVYGPAGCHACGAHSVRVDPDGNIWVVLGLSSSYHYRARFRGWGFKITPEGKAIPVASGIRSAGGVAPNEAAAQALVLASSPRAAAGDPGPGSIEMYNSTPNAQKITPNLAIMKITK